MAQNEVYWIFEPETVVNKLKEMQAMVPRNTEFNTEISDASSVLIENSICEMS